MVQQLFRDTVVQQQLFSDALVQQQLFRDAVVQQQLFKDAVMQHQLFRDAVVQQQLFRDAVVQQLFRDTVLQQQLFRDAVVQEQLFRDAVVQQLWLSHERKQLIGLRRDIHITRDASEKMAAATLRTPVSGCLDLPRRSSQRWLQNFRGASSVCRMPTASQGVQNCYALPTVQRTTT